MARIRIKLHLSKRQRLFLEVGIAILCIILFLGALNTINYTQRVPILTTEDLWKNANNTYIVFEFRNVTDPVNSGKIAKYSLADIAVYCDGYIYVSIPYPAGFEVIRGFSISLPMTARYMIEHGVNSLYIFIAPIGSPYMLGSYIAGPLAMRLDINNGYIWSDDKDIVKILNVVKNLSELFPYYDNSTGTRYFEKQLDIDVGSIVVSSLGYQNNVIGFHMWLGDVKNLEGLKLKIEMYAVSKKPVLKALTEPVYSVVSGLWAVLLAFWKRMKSYVASAFGGFSLSAIFTGLIGDPVTAMILSIMIITVLFLVMKKHR